MTAIAYSHCNQALSMVYQSLRPRLMKNVQQEHKRGADQQLELKIFKSNNLRVTHTCIADAYRVIPLWVTAQT